MNALTVGSTSSSLERMQALVAMQKSMVKSSNVERQIVQVQESLLIRAVCEKNAEERGVLIHQVRQAEAVFRGAVYAAEETNLQAVKEKKQTITAEESVCRGISEAIEVVEDQTAKVKAYIPHLEQGVERAKKEREEAIAHVYAEIDRIRRENQ